jgi:hypothetical protein
VRVATWRQRIDPVLSAEEDRGAFDIHGYGTSILTRLDARQAAAAAEEREAGLDGAVPFGRVVACPDRFEVARMFAAMLQLVNNRRGPAPRGPGRPGGGRSGGGGARAAPLWKAVWLHVGAR